MRASLAPRLGVGGWGQHFMVKVVKIDFLRAIQFSETIVGGTGVKTLVG